jgi:uncharacterized membrane protein
LGRLIALGLALTNLVEAEGRSVRRNASRAASRFVIMLVLGLAFLLGIGFALAGLFLILEPQTGAAGAAFITGLSMMALSGGAAWATAERSR